MTIVDDRDVERFREAVRNHLGLHFDEDRTAQLRDVLRRRLTVTGKTCRGYLDVLEREVPADERGALAEELTVTETYFFRHMEQFNALREVVLPERIRTNASSGQLRLASVGCASGEEAYTLAMVTRQVVAEPAGVTIMGVDINPAMLARARRGQYSSWSLRATPPDMRRRWFQDQGPDARTVVLDEKLRDTVRFVEANICVDDPQLWATGAYDVIFCRNVLMYFSIEAAKAVLQRLTNALCPGGYLFLGHAENLRGLTGQPEQLVLRHSHDTFYYQRPGPVTPKPRTIAMPSPDRVDDADWAGVIGAASGRVRSLTERRTATASATTATTPAATAATSTPVAAASRAAATAERDWELAEDLVRLERFDEALRLVEQVAPTAKLVSERAMLHAVLLAHDGQLDRAEQLCQRLLSEDPTEAGAHYVIASCREQRGDPHGTVNHIRAAAYLQPEFAMPRLRLGLLARQQGDHTTARRELGRALALLSREDSRRLLLFGGGFTRDALMALCVNELLASGGAP